MNPVTEHNRWDRLLAKLDLPETRYKADLELYDRSQAFSSELLKLALAGIAVIGFLLANFPKERLEHVLDDASIRILFCASVVAFALSVGLALLQRFQAGGAMFHHLHVIKLSSLEDAAAEAEISHHMRIREKRFMRAHALLKSTSCFLILAAVVVSVAFIRMMFLHV